jgi:hypothetical protein
MADICGTGFDSFFNTVILPFVGLAVVTTSTIIALSFMAGRATSNPKLTLWSRTEAIQLIVSAASVFFIAAIINTFCIIDMGEVANIFGISSPGSKNIYDAAEEYIFDAAHYAHNAMTALRYHLEGYMILSYLNAFKCDFTTGQIGWGCMFGYSGANQQPFGGYGATNAAMNIFFNSSIVATFTALNFAAILMYIYRGFIFVFLPLGVFLRAMPFLRGFGSLLIALALAFLTVVPLMLGVYWLMGDVLLDRTTGYIPSVGGTSLSSFLDEDVFPDEEGAGSAGQSAAAAFAGEDVVFNTYFSNGDNVPGVIMFAAFAFITAVFLPTVALIATIASVSYLARLYGQEIDLSKITQLV